MILQPYLEKRTKLVFPSCFGEIYNRAIKDKLCAQKLRETVFVEQMSGMKKVNTL